jgi:DNA invertase Pin-like site-specific DNA recombinase
MTEEVRNEISTRSQAGASQRQIARALHVSRHTVARVLAEVAGRRAGQATSRPRRRRQVDA